MKTEALHAEEKETNSVSLPLSMAENGGRTGGFRVCKERMILAMDIKVKYSKIKAYSACQKGDMLIHKLLPLISKQQSTSSESQILELTVDFEKMETKY